MAAVAVTTRVDLRLYGNLRQTPTGTKVALPLLLTVFIHGSMPHTLPVTTMPIDISVTIPVEYSGAFEPVIMGYPLDDPTPPADDDGERDTTTSGSVITFLPLPKIFDPTSRDQWADLGAKIETWLCDIVADRASPEWAWGVDAMYMAYFAATPFFPHAHSTRWEPSIGIDGTWGERWVDRRYIEGAIHLARLPECDGDCARCLALRREIWAEFGNFVRMFYLDGPIQVPADAE